MEETRNEAVDFIQEYYKVLVKKNKTINKFYDTDSQLSITKETEEQNIKEKGYYEEIFMKHGSKVDKVFISSYDYYTLDDLLFISIIGQFVYYETNKRFSQQFVIKNKKVIIDNCRLLDEEIIYSKRPKNTTFFKLDMNDKNKEEIQKFVGSYGRVGRNRVMDNQFIFEFSRFEDSKRFMDDKEALNYGFVIEKYDEKTLESLQLD